MHAFRCALLLVSLVFGEVFLLEVHPYMTGFCTFWKVITIDITLFSSRNKDLRYGAVLILNTFLKDYLCVQTGLCILNWHHRSFFLDSAHVSGLVRLRNGNF